MSGHYSLVDLHFEEYFIEKELYPTPHVLNTEAEESQVQKQKLIVKAFASYVLTPLSTTICI